MNCSFTLRRPSDHLDAVREGAFRLPVHCITLSIRHATCISSNKGMYVCTAGSNRKSYRRAKTWSCYLFEIGVYGLVLWRSTTLATDNRHCYVDGSACTPFPGQRQASLSRLWYHRQHLPTSTAFRHRHVQLPTTAMRPEIEMRLFATNPWLHARALLHLQGLSSCSFADGHATSTDGPKTPRHEGIHRHAQRQRWCAPPCRLTRTRILDAQVFHWDRLRLARQSLSPHRSSRPLPQILLR